MTSKSAWSTHIIASQYANDFSTPVELDEQPLVEVLQIHISAKPQVMRHGYNGREVYLTFLSSG